MSKKENELHNYKLSPTGYCSPADSNESVLLFNNLKWMTTVEDKSLPINSDADCILKEVNLIACSKPLQP
jgi:hypothetical protein